MDLCLCPPMRARTKEPRGREMQNDRQPDGFTRNI